MCGVLYEWVFLHVADASQLDGSQQGEKGGSRLGEKDGSRLDASQQGAKDAFLAAYVHPNEDVLSDGFQEREKDESPVFQLGGMVAYVEQTPV